jgi:hypothetical protein
VTVRHLLVSVSSANYVASTMVYFNGSTRKKFSLCTSANVNYMKYQLSYDNRFISPRT